MFFEKTWERCQKQSVLQSRSEYKALLKLMNRVGVKSVLEIGMHKGGTAIGFLCQGCSVTCIDPVCDEHFVPIMQRNYKNKFSFINMSSIDAWKELYDNPKEFDMLFIDGDHSAEMARYDYDTYKQFVKEGGLIVFHDVMCDECGVASVWKDLKEKHQNYIQFYDEHATPHMGIGVLWNSTNVPD